jgi:hypothetical protein
MPAHGKSKVAEAFGPKHCPSCPKGFVGGTTHRGTMILTPQQEKLFHMKEIRHTDWYRSVEGNLYSIRKFVK